MIGLSKMSTSEKQRPRQKTYYWSFNAVEFCECFGMTDAETGKMFKEILKQLIKNEVPENSLAYPMFKRTLEYRERQRERITNYWKQRNGNAEQEQPPEQPQQQEMRRPPRPRITAPERPKKPTLEEVYDYCDTIGTPPPIGREWYEWQESKGWNKITSTWQAAFRAFAKHKKEN